MTTPRVYRGQPSMASAGFGDLNGDGLTDVLTVDQTTDRVSFFQNEDGRYFGRPGGVGGVAPAVFQFGDLDRDSRKDILFVEGYTEGPNHIVTLLSGANGRFETEVKTETHQEGSIGDAVLADFRRTGHLDLLMVGQYGTMWPGSSYLAFAPGLGDGRFGPTMLSRYDGVGGLLVVADFNGDRLLDAATADATAEPSPGVQRVTVLLGNGDGTFRQKTRLLFGPSAKYWPAGFETGDFNRDGRSDLLVWTFTNEVPYQNHAPYQLIGNGDGTFQ